MVKKASNKARSAAKASSSKTVQKASGKSANQSGNTIACAVLAYFLVGIVWYFADEQMKKSAFVKRHATQGLVLLVVGVILSIVLSVAAFILAFIPILGWGLIWLLWVVFELGFLVFWLMGVIYAATGQDKKIPLVGDYAEKLKF